MDTCDLVAAKIEISEIAAEHGHHCDRLAEPATPR